MLRYVGLAAATTLVLLSTELLPIAQYLSLLPFSVPQGYLQTALKCVLGVWLVREANGALNFYAENRWSWKSGKGVWRWQDELAVVTGGSSGIGAMVVRKLVARGIRVAVLDVVPLSDVVPADERRLVTFYQCDITSRRAVSEVGEAIRSDHGSPSILINNAGIGTGKSILEISPQQLNLTFQVNIISHWNTVQEFLPEMIARKKGHVMSTASLAAFVSLAGSVDYSCTKAGLVAFHEGLGQELKHRYNAPEIKTSIVYPNWVRTSLTESIQGGLKNAGAPVMEPEEVAEAMVKQLISGRSGHVVLGPGMVASVRALPLWVQELIRDSLANIVQ